MTEPLDVAGLQRRLAEFAAARAWQPYHTPKNLASALNVEASELLEIFQWLTPEESARVMDDHGTAARVRDEVADVLAGERPSGRPGEGLVPLSLSVAIRRSVSEKLSADFRLPLAFRLNALHSG